MNSQSRKQNKNRKRNIRKRRAADSTVGSSVFSSKFNSRFPIDPRVQTCLKFVSSFGQVLATDACYNQQFNLNSLFDPNFSGGGTQPYRYDELCPTLYTRYRVFKCSWRILFPSGGDIFQCLVVPTNGDLSVAVTDASSFHGACELPFSELKYQGYGGCPTAVFSGSIVLNELGGVTSVQYRSDDRFQAVYNADPVEKLLLNVCAYNPGASGNIRFSIELCYEAELWDPPVGPRS